MANLAALLDKEASAEITAIISEARERASEIVAKAKEEAEGILAQRKRTVASQHESALVRAKSAAQLEASSMRLRAQHEAVEAVFSKVGKEVDALIKDDSRYKKVLETLLDEAVASVPTGTKAIAAVVVNPGDKKLLEEALKKHKLDDKVQTDESLRGGVRLKVAASNVAIENTLLYRCEALESELASDVSRLLVGQS